ncbi:MAG: hypothetical protein U1F76_10590 [Candidatus Competibacteraceae bacterium]
MINEQGSYSEVVIESDVRIKDGKLDVNGSIYQRGTPLHADYVFESGYELESIQEHAEFMWKNKHLRSIQPVTTDESGLEVVEVGSHFRSILEELEKAHIYIDQLHKQNKVLEERLAMIEEKRGKIG